MEFIDIKEASPQTWAEIWSLYEESFPAHERRSREAQLKAFDDPACRGMVVTDENNRTAAILFYWLYDSAVYVEFLAVHPRMRGCNTGTAVMERVLSLHSGCLVILEIEPPQDEATVRRLHFYERLGFVTNSYPYIHPSYRIGVEACPHPLTLLSHGRKLTAQEFRTFRNFMDVTVLEYSD